MKPKNSGALLLLFAAALGVLLPERAHAYLDPGTGSFLIQALSFTLRWAITINPPNASTKSST